MPNVTAGYGRLSDFIILYIIKCLIHVIASSKFYKLYVKAEVTKRVKNVSRKNEFFDKLIISLM